MNVFSLLEPLLRLLTALPTPLRSSPLPPPSSLSQTLSCLLTFPTTPLSSHWLSKGTFPPPPAPSPRGSRAPHSNFMNRLSVSIKSEDRSPSPPLATLNAPGKIAEKLAELAEVMTLPWDDVNEVRWPRAQVAEESLPVLFLLMARLCAGLEDVRLKIGAKVFPVDMCVSFLFFLRSKIPCLKSSFAEGTGTERKGRSHFPRGERC